MIATDYEYLRKFLRERSSLVLLLKYFTQIGESWQIATPIRAMVDFRPSICLAISPSSAHSMSSSAAMCSSISTRRPKAACLSASRGRWIATPIWCSVRPRPLSD